MKLILQRVARASVEVDGYVENRIGSGLVLFVALKRGDTLVKARQLASKVAKLAIWPELGNLDNKFKTNVQDNGFEVLVILQQSVGCSFTANSPSEDGILLVEQAKPMFQAFVEQLGKEYQQEMVVAATVAEESRVDITVECPGVFEIDTDADAPGAPARQAKVGVPLAQEPDFNAEILPEVDRVTKLLQRMVRMPKTAAVAEATRIFRVFGMKKFRSALADAAENEADGFVLAVQSAGQFFNAKQQDLLEKWLGGLELPPSVADEADVPAQRQIPQGLAVKREAADWTGRAAMQTPGSTGGRWAGKASQAAGRGAGPWGGKGVGFKGKGRGIRTIGHGIISMDGAAALHGMPGGSFGQGQLQSFSDKVGFEDSRGVKRGAPQASSLRAKFQKGTPTLAPMTPGPKNGGGMQEDEF